MKDSKKAWLGLGANLGDKMNNLQRAVQLLNASESIEVKAVSSLYETEPWGYEDQDWFLNITVEVETTLAPQELLDYCHMVESELRRERLVRWGPRTIDVDILLYEGIKMDEEALTIPHPRMKERGFVLIPLQEIAAGMQIDGETLDSLISRLPQEEVRKCGQLVWR